MLDGNLRQKESAMRVINDQKAVPSNLDGFRKNWLQRGEQGNLDAHFVQLRFLQRSKARVLQSSAYGAANDSLSQRLARVSYSNAPL